MTIKVFIVEIVKQRPTGQLEVAGRNCYATINVGDVLCLNDPIKSQVAVEAIFFYGKSVSELFNGYTATLLLRHIQGALPEPGDDLIDLESWNPPKDESTR